MHRRIVQSTITIAALSAALIHVCFPDLKIDEVTVMLLALASVPWLAPLFRSVELPGGLKIEFQELEKAERRAEESGLVKGGGKRQRPSQERHIYAYEAVAGSDPNLALAGLRIEIESRLRAIAKARGIANPNQTLFRLTRELVKVDALSQEEASAIADLLPLLNKAAHGAIVDEKAPEWALEFGPKLLDSLQDRVGAEPIQHLLDRWKNRDGAEGVEVGTALSKALVSSPRSFLEAMCSDSASFQSWLDELEHHTFTIFESQNEVDDDLYLAYYEKLRDLMIRAAEKTLDTEFESEAQRIVEALKKCEIRRIW